MIIDKYDVVIQEMPLFVNLAFYVKGCPLRCKGCHSPDLWTTKNGKELSLSLFSTVLNKYTKLVDNILFFGGEWNLDFPDYIHTAKKHGFKTTLFTGLELNELNFDYTILDFIKTGRYIEDRGGLLNTDSNQKLFDVQNGMKDITFIYYGEEICHLSH